jgi:hypothetical protein
MVTQSAFTQFGSRNGLSSPAKARLASQGESVPDDSFGLGKTVGVNHRVNTAMCGVQRLGGVRWSALAGG